MNVNCAQTWKDVQMFGPRFSENFALTSYVFENACKLKKQSAFGWKKVKASNR